MLLGIVPFGTNCATSFELDSKFFMFKSKYAFFISGKPTILPLALILVLPIPETSKFGNEILFSLPEITEFIDTIAFGFVSNGLIFSNVGANNKMSLKPILLFFKLAFTLISPRFS